jgi:nucleoside-diphosphate-sugar epimerase
MRIFLTGSTGYLGSAIAAAFTRAGHELVALTRPAGNLREPHTYRDAARACDVIVHAAIESGPDRLEVDRIAVDALAGPKLIYTSVMFVLGNVDGADESAPAHGPRAEHERIVLERGGAVIRPGMIHGGDAWLFAHPLYIGDGENRWPLVHRDDVAELYRLVAESGARGVFHAVAEIRRAKDVFPGRSVPLEDARRELGPFADALALDQNVTAPRSFALGWRPSAYGR